MTLLFLKDESKFSLLYLTLVLDCEVSTSLALYLRLTLLGVYSSFLIDAGFEGLVIFYFYVALAYKGLKKLWMVLVILW